MIVLQNKSFRLLYKKRCVHYQNPVIILLTRNSGLPRKLAAQTFRNFDLELKSLPLA